jgi:hypothetical protein
MVLKMAPMTKPIFLSMVSMVLFSFVDSNPVMTVRLPLQHLHDPPGSGWGNVEPFADLSDRRDASFRLDPLLYFLAKLPAFSLAQAGAFAVGHSGHYFLSIFKGLDLTEEHSHPLKQLFQRCNSKAAACQDAL